jgi:ankyrin repeat protein
MAEISICSPDKGLPVEDLPVPGRLQLFLAASSGDDERLQQLLSPPMAVTSEEDSALVVTNEGNSALHVVATDGDGAGHLESAKVIHDKAKHLLLACNVHGDTPLHCAARAGNTCMVSRLIELAGDAKDMVRVQNKDGKTALHEAIVPTTCKWSKH